MFSRSPMRHAALTGSLALALSSGASADLSVAGRVVTLNGEPLVGAMVSLRTSDAQGRSVLTIEGLVRPDGGANRDDFGSTVAELER